MRALLLTLIAAVALCAAGCGASADADPDQATLTRINRAKQHLGVLGARTGVNPLRSDADYAAYVRDMRSVPAELDTLDELWRRVPGEKDELRAYVARLSPAAGRARELAAAIESEDDARIDRALDAWDTAATDLATRVTALEKAQ